MTSYPALIAVLLIAGITALIVGHIRRQRPLTILGILLLAATAFMYVVLGVALNAMNL